MSFYIFIYIVKKSIPTGINRPPADTIYTIPKKRSSNLALKSVNTIMIFKAAIFNPLHNKTFATFQSMSVTSKKGS